MSGGFANRRVVVMGLGRFGGGIGVSRWLARQGADVLVTDLADESVLTDSIARLDGLGITFRFGPHGPADLNGAALLVVSPAVDKHRSGFVDEARRRGIPVTSEMNLFFERCRGRIVGVTGTVGKSTTCAMLYEILRVATNHAPLGTAPAEATPAPSCRRAHLGGNIGRSLLDTLGDIEPVDVVVLELSSYQCEDLADLEMSPSVAVITNVTPRHLDRHGTFDAYLECKLNICRYQRPGDTVVVGDAEPGVIEALSEIASRTGARMLTAHTAGGSPAEAAADDAPTLRVLGAHNRRNAALAIRVADVLGIGRPTATEALMQFKGLPHRLQFVRSVGGVDYYNDSKATAPEAALAAVGAFDRPVVLIAGGQRRPESWDAVAALRRDRLAAVIALGESGPALAGRLDGAAVATMADAVALAHRTARPGSVVLLSPGCPSFDQFVNYEARGEAFVRLVGDL